MSLKTTATVNEFLSTYAFGLMQDRLKAFDLANTLCPIVEVGGATGTYKIYDDRNAFAAPDTARALGGPRNIVQADATDGTYVCKPQGLNIGLDDYEIAQAGTRGPDLPRLKLKKLLNAKATAYSKQVVDFVFANLTAVAGSGNWSANDVDPLDQLDEQLDAISLDTGTAENKAIVMGVSEWRKLRMNTKAKARLGVKDGMSITTENLATGLLYPVKLIISSSVVTVTKPGQATVTKSRLMGGYCVIVHTAPNPSEDDASAFKCFSTSSVLVDGVREYRNEDNNSTMYPVDWDQDIKKTGSACARLLAIT